MLAGLLLAECGFEKKIGKTGVETEFSYFC
jgi:hypothetical protein